MRDVDAQPGEVEHERMDVRSVEGHLGDYARCEVDDQNCKDSRREAKGFVVPRSILMAVATVERVTRCAGAYPGVEGAP